MVCWAYQLARSVSSRRNFGDHSEVSSPFGRSFSASHSASLNPLPVCTIVARPGPVFSIDQASVCMRPW